MSLKTLTLSFPWMRYSKKLATKIDNPRAMGFFTKQDSEERGMRLVEGESGQVADGNAIRLYWLVDGDDGIIVDAKFQVFGQSALIGAAQVACELLVGKNYDQARRIGADLIDKQVQDRSESSAFPGETSAHLNLVLEAIEVAAEQCTDLPLPTAYVAPPAPMDFGEVREGGYPGWLEMEHEKKMAVLEQVLNDDIRPYIALDGGGVVISSLNDNKEVIITYQGNCTSCFSSVGATLSYIQQVFRAKVNSDIVVVPDDVSFAR